MGGPFHREAVPDPDDAECDDGEDDKGAGACRQGTGRPRPIGENDRREQDGNGHLDMPIAEIATDHRHCTQQRDAVERQRSREGKGADAALDCGEETERQHGDDKNEPGGGSQVEPELLRTRGELNSTPPIAVRM